MYIGRTSIDEYVLIPKIGLEIIQLLRNGNYISETINVQKC
ncbi:hypothetical protein [Clostridium tepidiprofundi]|nr:hypothetical protein [Clostridium tepidiprofundi]